MSHFAILCPAALGHVNPMSTLLVELTRRGHDVTWIGEPDGAKMARQRGFNAITIGEEKFPLGTVPQRMAVLGELAGLRAMRYTVDWFREATEVLLDESIDAIRGCGATALIADEGVFASHTIADLAELPWITTCGALAFHPDPNLPPFDWKYRTGVWARLRNRFGLSLAKVICHSLLRVLREARIRHGLPPYEVLHENASSLATFAQIPAEFDYPRRNRPAWFHYVGGFHDEGIRPTVEFPFDRLNGKPVVYASLGTVQNRVLPVFFAIAQACCNLPVQLVISLGGGASTEDIGKLPGDPIVVEFAPQLELIKRAKLVVTHAGMNTTIESIAQGVPMVAIPITNDQPAVAARVAWTGCGEVVPFRRVTAKRLETAVHRVLKDERYTQQARRLAEANHRAGGVKSAADIVESVLPATS